MVDQVLEAAFDSGSESEWIFFAPTADASDIDGNLLSGMVTARKLALEMLQDGTDTVKNTTLAELPSEVKRQ